MYYPFARKVLFQLDSERVHEFTFQQLRRITGMPFEALAQQKVPTKPVNCMGLTFKNPLGLTAGLDEDGEYVGTLDMMGSRSIETGTVTLRPQPGNDKPRPLRLVDAEGLINRMGFNNLGVDNLVENVEKTHYDGVLGINIGKDKDTPVEQSKGDYPVCMEKIYVYAGYIAVNISSPDTSGLRTLQYGKALDDFLTAIKSRQNNLQAIHHKYVPITVKIAPGLSREELIQIADSLVRHGIDGVIATNITLDRSFVQEMKNCDQTGGLSSRSLQSKSTEITRRLSSELNGRLPTIGVGGIGSAIAAYGRIAAGTLLVQIYFGFILKGSSLIKGIVTHI